MARFIIQGQRALNGTFQPSGNKNAALPMLAASLLTEDALTLHNVPHIEDVRVMLELLELLGVSVERRGHTVTLCAKKLNRTRLDSDLCRRVRSSILLAGPLTARRGRAVISPPGGDVIGRRRIDTHIQGLRALGISIEGGEFYSFKTRHLRGADILLDEASVTATENIMMAASVAEGDTTLFNAACEPHVQDLGALLNKMGADIEGLGTNRQLIRGREKLHGATHTVGPDFVEAGSYLAAVAATRGKINIEGMQDDCSLPVIRRAFERMGVRWSDDTGKIVLDTTRPLRIRKDYGSVIPKLEDGAWPAFPSDLMSVMIVLATQAKGSILFFEKMFESRMYFVDRLIEMGAHIIQCDPHRVLVEGPARLHGIHMSSPDIRAGMSMLIAALCAKGESVIESAQVIDRGYERVDERLRSLGADIVRED